MIRALLLAAALAAPLAGASASRNPRTPPATTAPAQRWDQLDDTVRYLRIMGTIDGFSATGPGAPCFPGRDNRTLDGLLTKGDFASRDPEDLASALKPLSDLPAVCATVGRRGYGDRLLKSMTDANLAVYIDAAVRGYAAVRPCADDRLPAAAAAAAAAVLVADDAAQPSDVMAAPIATACAGGAAR